MTVAVASFKGGVGKTTTAVHIAGAFQRKGRTLLVDGDPNRSATSWASRGSLPFEVADEDQAARGSAGFEHLVIDTEARPTADDLRALSAGCDLLVVPTTPDALAVDALMQTITALKEGRYRVLLTVVPPQPSRAGEETRQALTGAGIPVFRAVIRRLAAFQKAALNGCLVGDAPDPRAGLGASDYESVWRELWRQARK